MSEHQNEAESFAAKFGFGAAEQAMGQDLYQANVLHTKAHAAEIEATNQYAIARAGLIKIVTQSIIVGTALVLVWGSLCMIPVIIRLFRWAFGA